LRGAGWIRSEWRPTHGLTDFRDSGGHKKTMNKFIRVCVVLGGFDRSGDPPTDSQIFVIRVVIKKP
jgi:hypothetical protein